MEQCRPEGLLGPLRVAETRLEAAPYPGSIAHGRVTPPIGVISLPLIGRVLACRFSGAIGSPWSFRLRVPLAASRTEGRRRSVAVADLVGG